MTVLDVPGSGRRLAFLLLAAGAIPVAAQEDAALERGRALTRHLFAGHVDTLHAAMSEQLLEAIGGRPAIEQLVTQVEAQLGGEEEVITEEAVAIGTSVFYDRIARFPGVPEGTVTIHWSWGADGRLVGASVRPSPEPAPTQHESYTNRTRLTLPFDREWTVAWGGRLPHRNYHVVAPDQRFAYDFLIVRDGSTHERDGRRNADYHCFGQPIRAPAAGRVVAALDTLADNSPGRMLREVPAGNHVILDHGNGEYSLLAHLRHASVKVKQGSVVERGAQIGECGNSGNSSEPHLHYHLQDGPVPNRGYGLPAFFSEYAADGKPVELGEPQRGERIRQQASR